MLEGYLAFARGEQPERRGQFFDPSLLARQACRTRRGCRKRELTTELEGPSEVLVRPTAFSRLMANVVGAMPSL